MFNITCEMCGKTFEAKSKLAKYCESCKAIRIYNRNAEYRAWKREKKAMHKEQNARDAANKKYIATEIPNDNMKYIASISKEARKSGMTYGQYVASLR